VAIADPDLKLGQALATETGAKAVADYREFLGDVDAVVISSPNFLHREQAIACAQAGKHVFCEKPMGLSAADAKAIADAVAKAGVKSMVGFSPRLDPMSRTVLRYQKEGKFGDLISVFTRRLMFMKAPTGGWRADQNKSGGLLFEINIHELDWIMMLGGEVKSIYAQIRPQKAGAPRHNDHIWFLINFASGAVGAHEGSWATSMPQFFRGLYGTRGGATTDEWSTKLMYAETGQNRQDVTLDKGFDLRANFLDSIEHNTPAECDCQWGLKVMTVAEGLLESAAKNTVVKIG
jgi:predicted dehydrogenase